jgi:imidazoleglycerol phosphate dehydratase HisB
MSDYEPRVGTVERKTKETAIAVTWILDPSEADLASGSKIQSGIGFYDHMLEALAKHSRTVLHLTCDGDTHIDCHHTVEDCAIALGQCLRNALGDRAGCERYGHAVVPLDEALVGVTLDLSGRAWCSDDFAIQAPMIGELDTELVPHLFWSLAEHGAMTVHIEQKRGRNAHHIVEAAFKAFARALRQAIARSGSAVASTKGVLA